MIKLRQLTAAEIEKFTSVKGVKKIAVENFLSTLDPDIGEMGNNMNAQMDAQMYKWNDITLRSIQAGIRAAASKPKTIGKFGSNKSENYVGNVRDNRAITTRPEYVDLLNVARSLEAALKRGKYNRGERARLENALTDIQLVKELMM